VTVAPTLLHRRRVRQRYDLALVAGIALIAGGFALGYAVFDRSSGSGTLEGSGIAATETRQVPPFASIDLAGTNNAVVRIGSRRSVVVSADDNLLDRVTTRVRSGRLVIDEIGSFTTSSPMSVEVVVPSLDSLSLSGTGTLLAFGITGKRMTVDLAGTGLLQVSGTAARLNVSLDGDGDAELGQLAARDVHAVMNGTGKITVTATRTLDASVAGTGSILYFGSPARVKTNVTGTGAVVQG
jgi:Putative auto-transporter adhesin, head GIN domain